MIRHVSLVLLLLASLGAGALVLNGDGTFAGLTDPGQAGGAFTAEIDETGPHDPGHAYEDVDNDGRYTNGTDMAIPDEQLLDGRYTVTDPGHGLVLPPSTGTLQAATGIELVAGDQGHLIVEVKLETEGAITLTAGTQAQLEGLVAEAGDGITIQAGTLLRLLHATLEAGGPVLLESEGPLQLTRADLEAKGSITLRAGEDLQADRARLEATTEIRLEAQGDLYIKGAGLETEAEIVLEAGGEHPTLYVQDARLLDADETAQAGPSHVEIVGTPAEGEVRAA